MIQGVVGKPGGGKGAYAVEVAINWLVTTPYKIVGNFALLHGKIADYLQKKYPDKDFDLFNRIVLLNPEQSRIFFRIRNLSHLEKPLPYIHIYTGAIIADKDFTLSSNSIGVDYSSVSEPVLYLIDEAQVLFNNRAYAETGFPVRYYLGQHRKLNDELLLITQNMMLIDKQFRAWCQNFVYCRNMRKEMLSRFISAPKKLRRVTYLQAYESNPSQKPEEEVDVKFDLDVLNCFDTNAGVGLRTLVKTPESNGKRGISSRFVWVFACVMFALCLYAGWKYPRLLSAFAINKGISAVIGMPSLANKPPTSTVPVSTPPTPTVAIPTPLTPSVAVLPPPLPISTPYTAIMQPKRIDIDMYVQRLREFPDIKAVQLTDSKVWISCPQELAYLLVELDNPISSVKFKLSIHSFKKNKDYAFNLAQLNLSAKFTDILTSGQGVASLNLGKLIASFGMTNANYIQTDTYTFNVTRGASAKVSRGIEIPILSTVTQNNTTQTTTTYKAVLNTITATPRFIDGKIYLTLDMALQNLVDVDTKAISTTTYQAVIVAQVDTSYVLLDLSSVFKSKSAGLFNWGKNDDDMTYVVTLDIAP